MSIPAHIGLNSLLACVALLVATGCTRAQAPPPDDHEAALENRRAYREAADLKRPLERAPALEAGDTAFAGEDGADVPSALVDEIVADAAERMHVDPDSVEVRSASAVTWPDGSLGCPEPGREYTALAVPGYLVRVAAAGRVLQYRSDFTGRFFICGPDRLRRPGPAE